MDHKQVAGATYDQIEMGEYLAAKNEWEKLIYTNASAELCHEAEARVDALKAAAGEGGPDDPLCCQRYSKLHLPGFSLPGCRWYGYHQTPVQL